VLPAKNRTFDQRPLKTEEIYEEENMTSLIRTIGRSIGSGILVWLMVYAILLPVVDVSDDHGHGPDIGSGEWHSAVAFQTKKKKHKAAVAGIMTGSLMIPVCVLAQRCMRHKVPV
jgi:hypothetical protein